MKASLKKLVALTLIVLSSYPCKAQLFGKTFFTPRPQGVNSARQLVGQHRYMHTKNSESYYGTISATPEYLHAFKTRRLAEYFFGTDTIRFSGSLVTTREVDDILADYFGMSPTFDSTLTIDPQVRTALVDFDWYCGLDNLCSGLYFHAHTPVVWTKWQLELCETIANTGAGTPFPAQYMSENELIAPATSAIKPLQGDFTFGDVSEGIQFGRISSCPQKETALADVHFALGWNFIRRDRGHVGINLRVSAPTGSRPRNLFLFEPTVGNGHHWEFGAGMNGDLLLWEKDGEQTVKVKVVANFTHLFKTNQCRSFDFVKKDKAAACPTVAQSCRCCSCTGQEKNSCRCRSFTCPESNFGSRYMLLKEFNDSGAYSGTLLPAINRTTLPCKVSVNIQIDASVMAAYQNKNWTVDFGYNGWFRSREKICIIGTIEKNRYGFKGIQNVSGAGANNTQSTATIHGNTLDPVIQANVADATQVFISLADLDPCSAATSRSLTHKFFAHVSYAWDNNDQQRAIPYLGIGGEIEFEGMKDESVPNKNSLSQAGIWAKAGLAF